MNRKQASPAELAALLAECVCVPGAGEPEAGGHLAALLRVKADAMAEELLYLRAFAVDFAVLLALGDSPAKDQILSRYYEHWERIDAEVEGTLAIFEERLQDYAAIIGDIEPGGALRRRGQPRCGETDDLRRPFVRRALRGSDGDAHGSGDRPAGGVSGFHSWSRIAMATT